MSSYDSSQLNILLSDLKSTHTKLSLEIEKFEKILSSLTNETEFNNKQLELSQPQKDFNKIITNNIDNPYNLHLYLEMDLAIFENRASNYYIRPAFLNFLKWASNYFYCTIITKLPHNFNTLFSHENLQLGSDVTVVNYNDFDNLEDAIDPYNDFYLLYSDEDLDDGFIELHDDSYHNRCQLLERKPLETLQKELYEIIERRFKAFKRKIDDQRTDGFSSYLSLSTPENWTFEKAIKGKKSLRLTLKYVEEFSFEYIWKIENELTGTSKIIEHSKTLSQLIDHYKKIPSLLKKLEDSIDQISNKNK